MAMFPGDVGMYATPDGRTVQMPAGLAAQFPGMKPLLPPPPGPPPGQQIAPQGLPVSPDSAPPDAMTPLPLGASALPANPAAAARQAPPPPEPLAGPVMSPGQVPAGGPQNKPKHKGGAVTEPDQAEPGPANTPQQKQMTEDELAKLGISGPLNASQAASAEKRAAVEQQGKALADQSTAVGDAMAKSEQHAADLLEQQRQEAETRQAALDQQTTALQEQAKKIANTKIDRSVDHPILTAIGVALATLGNAMQNRDAALAAAFAGRPAPAPIENPGLKMMYAAIDRKVAAQIQDLDLQKSAIGIQEKGVEAGRLAMHEKLNQMDAYRIGYLDQAKQQIERIKAQTQSPIIQANTSVALADVDREKAETLGSFQARWQGHADAEAARKQSALQHAQTIGVQLQGQRLQYQMHKETLDVQERDKMAALAERLIEKGDAKAAAKAKDLSERAIWDPRTADVQLTPAGQAKFTQADQLEAAARQQQDPTLAQKQRQQAADLRDSARLNDGVLAPDKATAEKIRPQLEAAQNITDEVGSVIKSLESDPAMWNREKWADITTRLGNVSLLFQKARGERPSPKAFDQTLQHIINFDPSSLFDREASQAKAIASLKALKGIVAEDSDSLLKGSGVKSDWLPKAKGEDATSLDVGGKTAPELGADENPGILQRAGARIITGGTKSYDDFGFQDKAAEAAYAQPGAQAGLSPTQTAAIKGLAQRANLVGDAERAKIVGAIANPIQAGLGEGGRSSLAIGMLSVLSDTDPKLYNEVVDQLPRPLADKVRQADSFKRPAPEYPVKPGEGYNAKKEAERVSADEAKAAARKAGLDEWAKRQGLGIGLTQVEPLLKRRR